jgi:hypothetical protein
MFLHKSSSWNINTAFEPSSTCWKVCHANSAENKTWVSSYLWEFHGVGVYKKVRKVLRDRQTRLFVWFCFDLFWWCAHSCKTENRPWWQYDPFSEASQRKLLSSYSFMCHRKALQLSCVGTLILHNIASSNLLYLHDNILPSRRHRNAGSPSLLHIIVRLLKFCVKVLSFYATFSVELLILRWQYTCLSKASQWKPNPLFYISL